MPKTMKRVFYWSKFSQHETKKKPSVLVKAILICQNKNDIIIVKKQSNNVRNKSNNRFYRFYAIIIATESH